MISVALLNDWSISPDGGNTIMGILVTYELQLPELLKDHLKRLKQCTLRLFSNDIEPTPATETEDYDELVVDGYAPVALDEWGKPYLDDDSVGCVDHPLISFSMGPGAPGDAVYGYFVTDLNGYWLVAQRFRSPLILATVRTLTVGVRLRLRGYTVP